MKDIDSHRDIRAQIDYEDETSIVKADYDSRLMLLETYWNRVRASAEYRAHYAHLVGINGTDNGLGRWCLAETDREFIGNIDALKTNLYAHCQTELRQRNDMDYKLLELLEQTAKSARLNITRTSGQDYFINAIDDHGDWLWSWKTEPELLLHTLVSHKVTFTIER